jgi:hypothetical protein
MIDETMKLLASSILSVACPLSCPADFHREEKFGVPRLVNCRASSKWVGWRQVHSKSHRYFVMQGHL